MASEFPGEKSRIRSVASGCPASTYNQAVDLLCYFAFSLRRSNYSHYSSNAKLLHLSDPFWLQVLPTSTFILNLNFRMLATDSIQSREGTTKAMINCLRHTVLECSSPLQVGQ